MRVSMVRLNALSSIVCFLTKCAEMIQAAGQTRLNALSSIVCFLTLYLVQFGRGPDFGLNALSSIVCFLTIFPGNFFHRRPEFVSMPSRALYAF